MMNVINNPGNLTHYPGLVIASLLNPDLIVSQGLYGLVLAESGTNNLLQAEN